MKTKVKTWLQYCQVHYSDHTVKLYRRNLNAFLGSVTNGEITTSDIEDYITHVALTRCKKTANIHLTAIRSFCRWRANREGCPNPALGVSFFSQADTQPQKQRCLSHDEFKKVLRACDGQDCDIIEFIGHTGLRCHEFLSLTPTNIEGNLLRVKGKGNKERMVPLNTKAKMILDRNLNGERLRFVDLYHNRHELYNMCLRIARVAYIEPFGLHSIRHYFCTRLVQSGTPIKAISMIMGHSSISVTEQVYTHLTDQDLRGTTDVLCLP